MVPNSTVQLFQPATLQKRDDLVLRAEAIERVAGESSQKSAYGLLDEISEMLKLVESDRKVVVAPFLTAQRRINEGVCELIAKLEQQKTRLKQLIGKFQEEERRKQQEEQRKRDEELRKLNEERKKAEAAGNEEKMLATDMKAVEVVTAPVKVVPKAEGMKVVVRWVTTVKDPAALYKVFGTEFISLEPKMRDINAAVSKMAAENPEQPPTLPGCEIVKTTDVR